MGCSFTRKKMGWIYPILAPPWLMSTENLKPRTAFGTGTLVAGLCWGRSGCLEEMVGINWGGWVSYCTVSWGGFVLSWLGFVFFSSWLGWVGLFGFGKHPSMFWSHVFYLFFSCYIAAFQTNRGPDFLSLSLKTCGVCSVCLQIRKNAGISSQRVARVGCKSGPLEASRKVTRTAKSVDLDEFWVEQWSNEVANNDGKRDMSALQVFSP